MSGGQHHSNHPSVDQSDRTVPRNLRQTGDADIDLVISTRVRKSPVQANLGYQVPDDKESDYVGKAELERQKDAIENGGFPFTHKLVGLKMAGEPVYATLATVPFKQSANPSARERAKIHARDDMGE